MRRRHGGAFIEIEIPLTISGLAGLLFDAVGPAISIEVSPCVTARRSDAQSRTVRGVTRRIKHYIDRGHAHHVGVVGGKTNVILISIASRGDDENISRCCCGDGVIDHIDGAIRIISRPAIHPQ